MKNLQSLGLMFNFGQTVWLKSDPYQFDRIVTGVVIRPDGVTYQLTQEISESGHYDFEISANRDIVKATSN